MEESALDTLWEHIAPLGACTATLAAEEMAERPELARGLIPLLLIGNGHPSRWVAIKPLMVLSKVGRGSAEAVDTLLALRTHPNEHIHFWALMTLGDIGQGFPEVKTALIEALDQEDSSLRYAAARALKTLEESSAETIVALRRAMSGAGELARERIFEALTHFSLTDAQVIPAVLDAMSTADSMQLHEMKNVLATVWRNSRESQTALLAGIQHADFQVRRQVYDLFAKIGAVDDEVAQGILAGLSDPDQNVYQNVLDALIAIGKNSPTLVLKLQATFTDRSRTTGVRIRAINVLSGIGTTSLELRRSLVAALHVEGLPFHEAWMLRFAAVDALGELSAGDPEVITALLALLPQDHNLSGVAVALSKAGQGNPEVAARLTELVASGGLSEHGAGTLNYCLVRALADVEVPSDAAVQALTRALQHESEHVRKEAAYGLGKYAIGSDSAVKALLPVLEDRYSDTQAAAARALGNIGIDSPEVVEALLTLKSSYHAVHKAAADSLTLLSDKNEALKARLDGLERDTSSVAEILFQERQQLLYEVREAEAASRGRWVEQKPPPPAPLEPATPESFAEALSAISSTSASIHSLAAQIHALPVFTNDEPVINLFANTLYERRN